MPKIKTCYKVNDFEFDNIENANKFNEIYNEFKNKEQLNEIYLGIKNKIDYTIYAKPEFSSHQMELIRLGLEDGHDVSIYANQNLHIGKCLKLF